MQIVGTPLAIHNDARPETCEDVAGSNECGRLRVSVVTPSFNQGRYIEQTLRSILEQQDADVESIVMDGGSTDGSVDIIRKYADRLAHWTSQPDGGQYQAIDKGLRLSTGEIMGWLNSDDIYLPGTLSLVTEIFHTFPEIEWLTSALPMTCNEQGHIFSCQSNRGFDRRSFYRGANLDGVWGRHFRLYIQQESTFWRRSLWERAGGRLDDSLRFAGDYELWARFFQHAELYAVNAPLAAFRRQRAQKTSTQFEAYLAEAERVHAEYNMPPFGRLESAVRGLLRRAIGPRQLHNAPAWARNCLGRLPWCDPCKLVVWKDDRWQIVEDFQF